jgi:tetratricopeptide (TPR) repeat protein
MKTSLLAAFLLFTTPLLGDVETLVREGIALYDSGKYDEAISKFSAALAEDPSSDLAAYELALTYSAKGDNAQCIALLEPRAKKKSRVQAPMHAILGNCLDHAGHPDRAVAVYRRGLKINPNDTQLLYNLAVTLVGRNDLDEARKLLKKELSITPHHQTGHYLLGQVFEAQGYRIQAALSYLRFLSFAPKGERAADAAHRAVALLGSGVEVKDKSNVTITIDSKPKKGEGDYGMVEMMMGIAGASRFLPENESKSTFESTREHVRMALAMIAEAPPKGNDHTSTVNVAFFRTLYDRKLLDAYATIAVMPMGLAGTNEWIEAHRTEIDAYVAFMNGK